MSLMASQILKFVDFTKMQKSKYLENETFVLQIKKIINYIHIKCYFIAENTFVAEVTCKACFLPPLEGNNKEFKLDVHRIKIINIIFDYPY